MDALPGRPMHASTPEGAPVIGRLPAPAGPAPVEISGLSYAYGEGELRRPVLRDIALTVRPGEIVLLTGPSGSGKTTLLTLIGALRAMQEGSCRVLGQELMGAAEGERVALRRRIGFIFQQHNLLGFLTAQQNVAMALELDPATTEAGRLARATAMLAAVGLGDRGGSRPDQLSGGQRQRVAVARALAGDPGLILADEPTAALDRQSGGEVVRLLRDLARRRGVPILLVTHDPRILDIADRIIAMEDGRIVPMKEAGAVPSP
ncbi:ATP-binding cassette domain-containing protein [Roseicella aerolata]|uniref:ATP-binding cassette domain-containing protein n=1 Tax=Roseicella aerolata TaxID=2883479 RepID=A0A9X1LAM7_9PROT|nr:ATP-binding cassette domain-containing protein [Roseicella aerolata]MCB4822368.1 ATP-binding cassette domain-containing protein [Roseicella aerolata]